MITKLREGDFIYVGSEQCWEEICDTDKREWAHIAGVPRIDGPTHMNSPNDPVPKITFGWVRRKYIQEFTRPEDQEDEAKRPPPH
jgi:hypothetical protein